MRRYACIGCGETVRLHYCPDCCERCGGAIVDDEREIPREIYESANDGDPAAIVKMWHLGAPADAYPSHIIDDMLRQNRQVLLLDAYGVGMEAA